MAFTIYSASAGSGKTYTLVNEYLALTLPDPSRFNRVLAITFTNKAAAEMKNRIILALAELREGKDSERLSRLRDMTGRSEKELIKRADELMTCILHQYGDYAVMTIDSFILRLVRAFAFDLNLPLRFDVELSQDRVTSLLIERVIARAEEGHRIGRILKDYIISKLRDQQSWNYEEELLLTTREIFNDQSLPAITELLELDDSIILGIEQSFNAFQTNFLSRVRALCGQIRDQIEGLKLQISDFAYQKHGVYGQIQQLQTAFLKKEFEIKKRLRDDDWFTKKSPLRVVHDQYFAEHIDPMRHKLIDYIDQNLPRYCTIWDIKRTLPSLQLLKELNQELIKLGLEDRLVPIGVFNRKVAQIIRDEVIPYIYLRIGERFNHYLIDEFQDTSHLQWQNLFLLVENVIAEGHHSLVVGDPKQAIYRWRGGDPGIMEDEISRNLPAEQIHHKHLGSNFRSAPLIVEFNNRFFSDFQMDPALPLMDRFSANRVCQKAFQIGQKGYVEVRFFPEDKNQKRDQLKEKAINWTIEHIKSALFGGLKAREIAILIRAQKDALPLSRALIDAGIPIITSDSLLLNQSLEIRATISILRFFRDHDPLHILEILSFLKGIDFQAYLCRLPDQENQRNELLSLLPEFGQWEAESKALSLYDLAEEICKALSRFSATPTSLLAFLEVLYRESPHLGSDLNSFLEWWQAHENDPDTAFGNIENPNGVQIMTIHKAKGLEFPMVILPFCDWEIVSRQYGTKPSLWIQDQDNRLGNGPMHYFIPIAREDSPSLFSREIQQEHLANRIDNLHLLYVAFTRAKETLLVAVSKASEARISSWIRQRLDLWPNQTDSECFRLGSPAYTPSLSLPAAPSLQLQQVHIHQWQHRLVIRHQASEEWLEPHDPKTEGKKLHWILSHIFYEQDLLGVMQKAVDLGLITAPSCLVIQEQIKRLFDLPLFDATVRDMFNPPWQIRTEASILNGKELRRPDRIQFLENEILVIDFKRETPHPEHRHQLETYTQLLKDCYPGRLIRGVLIYVIGAFIETIPCSALSAGETAWDF